MYLSVKEQIDAFLGGFHEIVSRDLISVFNAKELELLISGLPNFDRKCAIYYFIFLARLTNFFYFSF